MQVAPSKFVFGSAWRMAVIVLTLQLASLATFLLPSVGGLATEVRQALGGITAHLVLLQVELALALMVLAFVLGGAVAAAMLAAGHRASLRWSLGAAVSLLLLGVAREVARRPALFEDLLWRRGGLRAQVQLFLAERVGFIALDRLAGFLLLAYVAIALVRRRGRARIAWAGFAVVTLGGLYGPSVRWPRKAHLSGTPIIVLAADSLRRDRLSSLGNPILTTPNLDALIRRGATPAELFVPIASTTASWTTFLTGLYPHDHGVRDLFPRGDQTHLHVPTVPRVLQEAGYSTSVVSDYAGESFSRIDFGFERADVPPATSLEVFADREALQRLPLALAFLTGAWGQSLFPVGRYLPVNADPSLLTDRVEAELSRLEGEGKPFFLVAFYSVTHLPFAPPMPDATRFTNPGYSGPSRYSYELQQLGDLGRLGGRPSDEEIAQVRGLYDSSLFSFDREVGRILERLEDDGLTDRIVVVMGDHGENLFEPGTTTEHGKWFKGGALANRSLFLVDAPSQHLVVPARVGGVEVMPLWLSWAGVPGPDRKPEFAADRPFFAETALWLGGAASAPPGALAYAPLIDLLEVEAASHALVLRERSTDETVTAKLRAVTEPPWVLVYTPTTEGSRFELFDLENDPWAERDLADQRPEVAARLSSQLLRWLEEDPLRWLDAKLHVVRRVEQ